MKAEKTMQTGSGKCYYADISIMEEVTQEDQNFNHMCFLFVSVELPVHVVICEAKSSRKSRHADKANCFFATIKILGPPKFMKSG